MNRQQLIDQIAEKTGLSKAASGNALAATLEAITHTIAKGETVQLIGFGTFKTSHRAARLGKNPKTGEEIEIPEARIPKLSFAKHLKDVVNG
ncbi:HU family DNA-binding protein [Marinomonas sp. TI.3.20]|uniref:HU family DNA-binding protein n=1 Tax=Marinomonas sp. TI.3.20 TaxID=3121296 RepID=UPI00311F2227